MYKLLLVAFVLLTQGCATYSQALNSSNGNGIVLYSADSNPRDICKYEFNRNNKYPETVSYWDIEWSQSTSTMFISGSYRRHDASHKVHQVKCVINYWEVDGVKYMGIKGVNTLYPQGPAIGWYKGDGGAINLY